MNKLIIISISVAVIATIFGFILIVEYNNQREIELDQRSIARELENKIECGEKYVQRGNVCLLNPDLLEPNTIVIYPITDNSGTRLAVSPHFLVINLEENSKVTWVNQGMFTASISDFERGLWSIDDIKPSSQKSIQFNNTGYYMYLVDAGDKEMSEIIVLSDNTNSLPVDVRARMAQGIVSRNLDDNSELVGVGSGGASGTGITITINEKVLNLHEDAGSYYYEKYRNMIPFDVPITIEFSSLIIPQ